MKHSGVVNRWADTERPREGLRNGNKGGSCVDTVRLRTRISDQLDRLSAVLMSMMRMNDDEPGSDFPPTTGRTNATKESIQNRIRLLGQLAVGLAVLEPDAIPATGAG